MKLSTRFLTGLFCALATASAQPIIEIGSTQDLWDVSRGTTVTATSGGASQFQAENAFGGRFDTVFGNPLYDFIFQDGMQAGFVHFMEWRTTNAVTVRSFRLHAQGDGSENDNGREFETFTLKAKTQGSTNFNAVLYQFTASHPYQLRDARQRIVIAANIAATTATEFRAEFTDRANRPWSGPRVIELDGFSENLPLEIYPATELLWETVPGTLYQAQWTTDINSPTWINFGSPFIGDGQTKSMFDSTRSETAPTRYYRLVQIQLP
jgi:hypothetical protein